MGATARTVDFSNVKDGGNFNRKRIKAGDYAAKITKVEDAVAKDDVAQYLFTIKLVNPSTSVFPYYCKLTENQLWKLRNLFIAAGIVVPKKKTKVDPNKLLNKTIGVTIEDDEYEGKEQSTISGVFPASELDDSAISDHDDDDVDTDDDGDEDSDDLGDVADDDNEADEDSSDEDSDDEDEPAGDKFDAMDRNELKAVLKKSDADFVAKKSQSDDDLRELARKAEAKKAASTTKKSAKKSTKDLSDEDIEDLDIDDI